VLREGKLRGGVEGGIFSLEMVGWVNQWAGSRGRAPAAAQGDAL